MRISYCVVFNTTTNKTVHRENTIEACEAYIANQENKAELVAFRKWSSI